MRHTEDLSIIQKTYDFIVWFVPILNRLPRDHKFLLGDRIVTGLYDVLETLIEARYAGKKLQTCSGDGGDSIRKSHRGRGRYC